MGIFILLNTAEREVDKMKIISFMLVLVVGISWKHVEARPQDDKEGDADFWYGVWGYGPRPAALKEIVAKEEDDVGSKADKIANAADAGGWMLLLFVVGCRLSLFVVVCCWLSLVVVCRWLLFVIGRCLSLVVVCRWLLVV